MIQIGNLDLGRLIENIRYFAWLGYSHFKKLFVVDDLLLDHVGLPPYVLVLVVHLGHTHTALFS